MQITKENRHGLAAGGAIVRNVTPDVREALVDRGRLNVDLVPAKGPLGIGGGNQADHSLKGARVRAETAHPVRAETVFPDRAAEGMIGATGVARIVMFLLITSRSHPRR